jgi:hypothetical protein
MSTKSAMSEAFVEAAAGIDERYPGYRQDLIAAVIRIGKERDVHGTDNSRRSAIEDSLSPLVQKLAAYTGQVGDVK